MANASVKIEMTADGKPIAALQNLIAQRMKYTNETAKQALAACAIQILISLRSVTAVAKAEKPKVEAVDSLYPSFYKNGKHSVPCLRFKGSNARYETKGVRILWPPKGTQLKFCQVFSFVHTREKPRECLVVAFSAKTAKAMAQEYIRKRIEHYKGLAKLALGKLMNKAAITSRPINDVTTEDAKKVANEVSDAYAEGLGDGKKGRYSLTCEDNLDYAMDALKGGQAAFNLACAKAANKIASVIKQKVADKILAPNIETPFPDVRSRK